MKNLGWLRQTKNGYMTWARKNRMIETWILPGGWHARHPPGSVHIKITGAVHPPISLIPSPFLNQLIPFIRWIKKNGVPRKPAGFWSCRFLKHPTNIGLFEPYPYGHMGLGDPKIIFFPLKLYFGSTVYPVGLLYLYFCQSGIEVSPVETAAVYRHKNAVKPS
jgi:hypothetical protein